MLVYEINSCYFNYIKQIDNLICFSLPFFKLITILSDCANWNSWKQMCHCSCIHTMCKTKVEVTHRSAAVYHGTKNLMPCCGSEQQAGRQTDRDNSQQTHLINSQWVISLFYVYLTFYRYEAINFLYFLLFERPTLNSVDVSCRTFPSALSAINKRQSFQ